jgi:LPXTG-motif cell wall-anchored protein
MAVAAATAAVLTPATFLVAPTAFATTGSPSPTDSAGTPTPTTPSDGASTPSASSGTPTTPPASSPPASSPPPSSPPASSPPPSGSADPEPCDNSAEFPPYDEKLAITLSGLPKSITAGSGFHPFTISVKNENTTDRDKVMLRLYAMQTNPKTYEDYSTYTTAEYKDPATGKWTNTPTGDADFTLDPGTVKANSTLTLELRLSVDKAAPADKGGAISEGRFPDADGNCVYLESNGSSPFDVVAAGGGGSATPSPSDSVTPSPTASVAPTATPGPDGSLASTGSSSVVPTLGLLGGVAVVAGTGVVFAVRRRRSDSAA